MINKKDETFSLCWAKKIKAVNMLGGKCIKCKTDNIFVLEFHHRNEKEKEFGISWASGLTKRWDNICQEIKKCDLLCSNCHAEYHHINGRGKSIKQTVLLKSIEEEKCSLCGYKGVNMSSLCFHHNNGVKLFNIADYFSRHKCKGVSLVDLENEILKCTLLCRNCHAIEHIDKEKFNSLKTYIYEKIETYKKNSKTNVEEVIKLKNEGKGICEIAKILGKSKSSIHYTIHNSRV